MNRRGRRVQWPRLVLVISALCSAAAGASGQAINRCTDLQRLTVEDKSEIADVLSVQARLGAEAWPGFGRARIPIVLYDDRCQFLMGAVLPPSPWVVVQADSVAGRRYYRRDLANARSFAVRIGDVWAGSLSTHSEMNRRSPIKVRRDSHVAALLHEMFHAFQATKSPTRFRHATSVYRSENRYPLRDSAFAADWDREGFLLAKALRAAQDTLRREAIREFLEQRRMRRARAAIDSGLVAFERELEWLEGLGKYVEVRLYMLAASQPGDSTYSIIGSGTPYAWQLVVLERQLGRQNGDLRFYLSGMAQASLLDHLNPGWKAEAFNSGVFLEDLLHTEVNPHSPSE